MEHDCGPNSLDARVPGGPAPAPTSRVVPIAAAREVRARPAGRGARDRARRRSSVLAAIRDLRDGRSEPRRCSAACVAPPRRLVLRRGLPGSARAGRLRLAHRRLRRRRGRHLRLGAGRHRRLPDVRGRRRRSGASPSCARLQQRRSTRWAGSRPAVAIAPRHPPATHVALAARRRASSARSRFYARQRAPDRGRHRPLDGRAASSRSSRTERRRTTWCRFGIMASVSLMLAVLWRAVAAPHRRARRAARRDRALPALGPQGDEGDAPRADGRRRPGSATSATSRSSSSATSTGPTSRARPLTLCLVDLDDFKTINDTYGHPVGDRVLSQVAARLRRGGESFRIGGDEFALLLPGRDAEEGRAVAEAVSRRIAERDATTTAAPSRSRSASRPTRRQGVDRSELVRVADKALYSAKGHGKARVHVYRPDERMARPRPAARTSPAGSPDCVTPRAPPTRSSRATSTSAATRTTSASSRPASRTRLGLDARPGRAHPGRREPPRHRQAPRPRGDPPQARPAHARRARASSSATRRSATGCSSRSRSSRSRPGCSTTTSAGTATATRTASRARTSRSPSRILFVADALRHDDDRPRLPREDDPRRGARRARALLRHAVRPGRSSTALRDELEHVRSPRARRCSRRARLSVAPPRIDRRIAEGAA